MGAVGDSIAPTRQTRKEIANYFPHRIMPEGDLSMHRAAQTAFG